MFDYQMENAARAKDVLLLAKLRLFSGVNNAIERVRLLTYLPSQLWHRQGWLDLHGPNGEETCPDISEVKCPAG